MTYSPSNMENTTKTSTGFITDQEMFNKLAPVARTTTSSLDAAKLPKPTKLPTNAANGINS